MNYPDECTKENLPTGVTAQLGGCLRLIGSIRNFLQFLNGIARILTVAETGRKQAMDNDVGIAPNWRSEVGVTEILLGDNRKAQKSYKSTLSA